MNSPEREILKSMQSLREMPLDPSLSTAAMQRVQASLAPAKRGRRGRIALAVAVAAALAGALYLRWPTEQPQRPVRPAPVVANPNSPAEELKQAAVKSHLAGATVHVQQVDLPPSSTGTARNVGNATVRLIGSDATKPATRPIREPVLRQGEIPLTWEGTSTIPIPLTWPNLEIRPLFISETTRVEKVRQPDGILYRLSNPAPPAADLGSAPAVPVGGSVLVDPASGLITRMQVPTADFQKYRELKLTYEPQDPATTPSAVHPLDLLPNTAP
jgi:hypothetical protein